MGGGGSYEPTSKTLKTLLSHCKMGSNQFFTALFQLEQLRFLRHLQPEDAVEDALYKLHLNPDQESKNHAAKDVQEVIKEEVILKNMKEVT